MYKKILIFFFLILFFFILYISIPLFFNNVHNNKIVKIIENNTNIKDISYVNLENNYYVVKSKDKIYVLDINYNIITNYDIKKIKKYDMDLVFKRNNLYYVNKEINDNSIIYNYYDIYSLDKKFDVVIGG